MADQQEQSGARRIGPRLAIWAGLAWILAVVLVATRREAAEPVRPTVVALVVWDSVALDRLGVYGYDGGTTPTLDALAAEALVFEAHVPCVDTTAASMASLLTGLRPRHHGLGRISPTARRELPEPIPSLAEGFRADGWTTLAGVSLPHLEGGETGFARGFDVYEGPPSDPVRAVRTAEETFASIRKPLERALSGNERVFIYLQLSDVRAPQLARSPGAGRFLGRVATDFASKDPELSAQITGATEDAGALQELVDAYARRRGDPVRAALDSAFYDAAVGRMDDVLSQLLAMIARHGRGSFVAVTGARADAGLLAGSGLPDDAHRRVHTPFVMSLPATALAGRSSVPTQDLDLAPTIARVAGLEAFEQSDGVDLLEPLLAGAAREPARVPLIESGDLGARLAVADPWLVRAGPAWTETAYLDPAQSESLRGDEPARAAVRTLAPLQRFRVRVEGTAPVRLRADQRTARREPAGTWQAAPAARLELTLQPGESVELATDDPGRTLGLELTRMDGASLGEVWIGGRELDSLDLITRGSSDEPWPLDAQGAPRPAAVAWIEAQGGWSTLSFAAAGGELARALVQWVPGVDPPALAWLRAPAGVRVERHPDRPQALVIEGAPPFELELRRRPGRQPAMAAFIGGRRVPARELRLQDAEGRSTRGAGEDSIEVFLTPGAWADPALYTPAPVDFGGGVLIELLDPLPPAPLDAPRDDAELLRRKQLQTTD